MGRIGGQPSALLCFSHRCVARSSSPDLRIPARWPILHLRPVAAWKAAWFFAALRAGSPGGALISLPFSDHCEPLLNSVSDESVFLTALEQALHREKLRYIEMRPVQPLAATTGVCRPTQSHAFHQLDLAAGSRHALPNCHKSSTQRKIRRAEREGLICETGRSEALLDAFWNLLLMTRRRHRVPPQPKRWFRNLIDCFGDALQIRVAYKDRQPVASILTLRHKDTLVYKYGCSDERFNNLGGTQLLFWRAIQEAKRDGLRVFDLGPLGHRKHGH